MEHIKRRVHHKKKDRELKNFNQFHRQPLEKSNGKLQISANYAQL